MISLCDKFSDSTYCGILTSLPDVIRFWLRLSRRIRLPRWLTSDRWLLERSSSVMFRIFSSWAGIFFSSKPDRTSRLMGKLLSMLRSPDTLVHVILASLHSQPLGQMYDDEEEAVMALSSTNSATSANRGRWRWEVVDDDATPDDVIVMLSRATARYGGTGSFLTQNKTSVSQRPPSVCLLSAVRSRQSTGCSWTRWFRTTIPTTARPFVSVLHFNTSTQSYQLLIISKSVKAQRYSQLTLSRSKKSSAPPHIETHSNIFQLYYLHEFILNLCDDDLLLMKTFRVGRYRFFYFNFSLDHRFLLTAFIAFPVSPFFLGCTHVHVSFRTMMLCNDYIASHGRTVFSVPSL